MTTIIRRRSLLTAAGAAALLFGTAACSGADSGSGSGGGSAAGGGSNGGAEGGTVSVDHAQGTTEVPVNPATVFVFDLGVLDTLTALGVTVAGIPEAVYPESVQQTAEQVETRIGTLQEPDFEAIASAAPDLIIITNRVAEAYGELSKIAPTIDMTVDVKDDMASFRKNVETLGEIFSKQDEAAAGLDELDQVLAESKTAVEESGLTDGLVLMTSAGEVSAYGEGSRFGLVYDELGVTPTVDISAEARHGESVSFEFLAEKDPGALFVVDRDAAIGEGGEAAAAVLDNALVNGTRAAQDDRIVMLDSGDWYIVGYGLENLKAMARQVAEGVSA